MSINRQHGQMCITCNDCSDELDSFETDEFEAMLADCKAHGWRIVNHDGTWAHHCGCCKRDRAAEARRMLGLCN